MKYPLDVNVRQITRNAGVMRFKSVIDFLRQLKPEHIQGFWHFASEPCLAIICTFSLVLLATSTDSNELKDIYSQIAEFRWLLNINGPSAGFTKSAVDLLQSNASFLAAHRPPEATKVAKNNTQGQKDQRSDQMLSTPHSDPGSYGDGDSQTTDLYSFGNLPPEFQASPSGIDFDANQYWPHNFEDLTTHT